MELQTILNADYLDIIYDHRNKNYGGYELRKHYGQRLARAAGIVVLCLTGLACLALMRKPSTTPATETARNKVTVVCHIPTFERPKPQPASTTPPAPAQKVKTKSFTEPVITKDPIPDEKQMTKRDDLHDATAGTSNTSGPASTTGTSTNNNNTTGGPGTITETPPPPKAPLVFASQMPEFVGDMRAFLGGHMLYPAMARDNGIEGQVIIRFVVNEDGSVSDATVVRGIGGGCDEEALRIVRAMPRWKPGKQNGTPVKVFFTLPIKFELH